LSAVNELVKKIEKASESYYAGDAIISDEEFDLLLLSLKELDPDNHFFSRVGSAPKISHREKAKHKQKMGSLLKISELEDLRKWAEKYTTMTEFIWADKLDGLSISLEYQDGKFVRGVTRGDGEVGEDITANVNKMKFPKEISILGEVLVRGEMVIPLVDWNTHFKGDKNPRNSVSGTSRRIDGCLTQHVQIYAFSLITDKITFNTLSESFELLSGYGFKTPRYGVVSTLQELSEELTLTNKIRPTLSYEIDGIVISENSIKSFKAEGEVDGRPRAARAFKFEAAQAISILREVEWQTGRTGVITPVAILDPVIISGVTISRATLCNVDEISRLGIGIGSKLIVKRANDVIPKIVSTVTSGEKIKFPTNCPSCGSVTIIDEVRVTCTEKQNCPAQNKQIFIHYLDYLSIKGMGEKLVEKLMDAGKLKDLSDLYRLKIEDISELERMGEKVAKKVINEIEVKSKDISVPKFIGALGMPGFSTKTAEKIFSQYSSLDSMMKISREDLVEIDQVGDLVATAVIAGFERNLAVITKLRNYVTLTFKEKRIGQLTGMIFCFTGFRDQELSDLAQSHGAEESDSLTKKTTHLVAKDLESGSSKLEKARKAGVNVVGINEFKELLNIK
jgi:DNA ligase (NAD+)